MVKEKDALLFLAPLAYWMHQERPTGLIKTSEVKARLMQYLAYSRQASVEDEKIEEDVDDFLRRVREHTGVFVERTTGWYGFMHLTFEEYFVAREIARRAKESAEKIYPYRHHPRWQEPIMLAIGFISTDRPDDASELVQTAILGEGEEARQKGFTASLFEDVLHRDLLLAVQCLGDCNSTDAAFRNQIVTRLINTYFESTNQRLEEKVEQTLKSLKGSDLEADLVGIAVSHLDHEDDRKREKAIVIFKQLAISVPEVMHRVLNKLTDQSLIVRFQVIQYLDQLEELSLEVLKRVVAAFKAENSENVILKVSQIKLVLKSKELTPEIETCLLKILENEDQLIQLNVAAELGRYKEFARKVSRDLVWKAKELTGVEKSDVLLLIGLIGPVIGDVVPLLLEQLKDQSEDVRHQAVFALGLLKIQTPEIVQRLMNCLDDKSDQVKWQSIQVLGNVKENLQEIEPKLIEKLNDSRIVQYAAAMSLKRLKLVTPEMADGLLSHISDDIHGNMNHILELLEIIGILTPQIEGKLLQLLKDERDIVRSTALKTLCALDHNSKGALESVRYALDDKSEKVRSVAMHAIQQFRITSLDIQSKLEFLIGHETEKIQIEALHSAGRLKPVNEKLTNLLIEKILDRNELVGTHAAFNLVQLIKIQPVQSKELRSRILKNTFSAFQKCTGEDRVKMESGESQSSHDVLWESLWQMCEVFEG